MRRIERVYVDTSVFGGVFDDEFAKPSRAFFDMVRAGHVQLVVSALVKDEVTRAPSEVSELLDEMLSLADVVTPTDEAVSLMHAYIAADVLSERWQDDALHVALATVSGCTLIASWNFKHIVNYRRIPKYNAVNALNGYPAVAIHSPSEVVGDE